MFKFTKSLVKDYFTSYNILCKSKRLLFDKLLSFSLGDKYIAVFCLHFLIWLFSNGRFNWETSFLCVGKG